MFDSLMVVERNVKLVGESIDNSGADAETSEGAGAREKSDFGEVGPVGVIFGEFVVDEGEDFLGEVVLRMPSILVVVEAQDTGVGGGVEVEFHRVGSDGLGGIFEVDL